MTGIQPGSARVLHLHCEPQTYLLASAVQREQLEDPSPEPGEVFLHPDSTPNS